MGKIIIQHSISWINNIQKKQKTLNQNVLLKFNHNLKIKYKKVKVLSVEIKLKNKLSTRQKINNNK